VVNFENKIIEMNVLTSYMVREILKGSLITLCILLTLFNLFTFGDELKDIGKGDYGIKQIFYYLTFTSPMVVYELIPSSALIGSLFVLGSMANNRELVAMQASGLSVLGIIRAMMLAGVVMVTFAMLIGEFIAPLSERVAQKIKTSALHEHIFTNTKYGLWLREGNDYVNVREVLDDGKLVDISIYKLDNKRHLSESVHAEKATFKGNNTWQLENIKKSFIATEAVTAENVPNEQWHTTIAPNLFNIVVVEPNNLSLYDLAMYINFLQNNHQKSHTYEVAFWGRAINPISTFVMLLVSAPFVIGIHRGISVGARIMIGVTLGMAFNVFDKIINHMGLIYNLNPPLMAFLPSLLVLLSVMYILKKTKS
jgi:lipopolysaccharide export system permease protein